jgi:hypothetical protein
MSSPDDTTEQATLTVIRDTPNDVQDRWVRLWVDGTFWEILRYGHTLSRPIPAGHHKLKGHNTLHGDTIEFDARPGDHIRVRVHNAISTGGFLTILMIGVAPIKVKLELVDA